MNAAIHQLRTTLETNPLIPTLVERVAAAKEKVRTFEKDMKDMATITLPQEVAKAVAAEKEKSRAMSKGLLKEIETLNKCVRELRASGKNLKQSIEDKERDLQRQLKTLDSYVVSCTPYFDSSFDLICRLAPPLRLP